MSLYFTFNLACISFWLGNVVLCLKLLNKKTNEVKYSPINKHASHHHWNLGGLFFREPGYTMAGPLAFLFHRCSQWFKFMYLFIIVCISEREIAVVLPWGSIIYVCMYVRVCIYTYIMELALMIFPSENEFW